MRYIDLAYEIDGDNHYDLIIENGDFKLTGGIETALLVSLFSDRRAYADEVPNPLNRRGWIGDIVADEPGDKHGSGLWFYEQSRLITDVENGVRDEAEKSLRWTVTDQLANFVDVKTAKHPGNRRLTINIKLTALNGGVSSHAYDVVQSTNSGAFAR